MDLLVIRNKSQLLQLANQLNARRLPFKIAVQDIYPIRSIESNNYYWGIVLDYIAKESGHSQEECHEAYKRKFNFRYDIEYNEKKKVYRWVMGTKSTTILDEREIWDYIFKVRADSELEHHIIIPLPSEVFINELKFDHDKIKRGRL